MIWFIVYGIILLVYFGSPKHVKFVIFLINLFIPDPIPYIDEVLMGLGLLSGD